MKREAFTLLKKDGTEELHLFKGKFEDGSCRIGLDSICGNMQQEEQLRPSHFSCKPPKVAKLLCEKYGDKICQSCYDELLKNQEIKSMLEAHGEI